MSKEVWERLQVCLHGIVSDECVKFKRCENYDVRKTSQIVSGWEKEGDSRTTNNELATKKQTCKSQFLFTCRDWERFRASASTCSMHDDAFTFSFNPLPLPWFDFSSSHHSRNGHLMTTVSLKERKGESFFMLNLSFLGFPFLTWTLLSFSSSFFQIVSDDTRRHVHTSFSQDVTFGRRFTS